MIIFYINLHIIKKIKRHIKMRLLLVSNIIKLTFKLSKSNKLIFIINAIIFE